MELQELKNKLAELQKQQLYYMKYFDIKQLNYINAEIYSLRQEIKRIKRAERAALVDAARTEKAEQFMQL